MSDEPNNSHGHPQEHVFNTESDAYKQEPAPHSPIDDSSHNSKSSLSGIAPGGVGSGDGSVSDISGFWRSVLYRERLWTKLKLDSMMGTDMVDILVGLSRRPIRVHKDLLYPKDTTFPTMLTARCEPGCLTTGRV